MDEQKLVSYLDQFKESLLIEIRATLTQQNKKVFTLKEAAEYLNVSFNTFQKFRYEGLKVFELDGTKRVTKEELDKFIEKNSYKIGG
ncbi:helix-turn-helix domain-containing protein [Lysinibacillus sp. NPDC094177]|uniref:helix-turn-helix domain-containing protein n=1 Tax=Lysinibacillus sp. NPDC094177 TaxID=3390580 RepID=UPI003D019FA0